MGPFRLSCHMIESDEKANNSVHTRVIAAKRSLCLETLTKLLAAFMILNSHCSSKAFVSKDWPNCLSFPDLNGYRQAIYRGKCGKEQT